MDKFNTRPVSSVIPVMSAFIWIGFICAISFMEAWLKFRAPNVTLPIGLSIGRVVFFALNKAEWVFAAIIAVYLACRRGEVTRVRLVLFGIPVALLLIQTLFLLPALNARVELVLQEGRFSSLFYPSLLFGNRGRKSDLPSCLWSPSFYQSVELNYNF